jgi:hypothetical protein
MAPELYVAEGLYVWTLELANGAKMNLLASSLASAIAGTLPSPVVVATRGAAFDEDLDSVPPVLTSLTPPSAKLGDPNFTLHVIGTGFRPGSVILWNGGAEPTTYVSATELTTGVNMATAAVAMPIPVQVETVSGLRSNVLTFDLQPAP